MLHPHLIHSNAVGGNIFQSANAIFLQENKETERSKSYPASSSRFQLVSLIFCLFLHFLTPKLEEVSAVGIKLHAVLSILPEQKHKSRSIIFQTLKIF